MSDIPKWEDTEDIVMAETPTWDDTEEINESVVPDEIKSPAIGVASGLAAQKLGESLVNRLGSSAEDAAFSAIGGEDTGAGRKFLKQQKDLLDLPDRAIQPRTIGREVLDNNILGVLGLRSPGKSYDKTSEILSSNIEKTDDLLKNIQGSISQDDFKKRYLDIIDLANMDPEADQTVAVARALDRSEKIPLEKLGVTPKLERSALELEKLKREAQKKVDFSDPTKTAKETIRSAKRRAAKDSVESLVESQGGEELLKEFRDLKERSGKLGTVKDILADKTTQTPNPIANKSLLTKLIDEISRKGAGVKASTFDTLSKIGKSGIGKTALKSLPFVGAAAGFSSARAEGATPFEAATQTALEEATDILGPVKMALEPGELGGPKDTPESILEDPEASPEEREAAYRELTPPDQSGDLEKENKFLYEASDDELINVADRMAELPQGIGYARALDKAVNDKNMVSKNATLFGLQQQPAFRELLKRVK